jgi:hypothetical protein
VATIPTTGAIVHYCAVNLKIIPDNTADGCPMALHKNKWGKMGNCCMADTGCQLSRREIRQCQVVNGQMAPIDTLSGFVSVVVAPVTP